MNIEMSVKITSAIKSLNCEFMAESLKSGVKFTIMLDSEIKKIGMLTIPNEDDDALFCLFLDRKLIVVETLKKEEISEFIEKLKNV